MKKLSIFTFFTFFLVYLHAQVTVTPQSQYGRVYTILNTKCQNQSCHSINSGSSDNLKFDGDSDAVYHAIFNQPSGLFPRSVANHDMLVNPQMPYNSFLLKKMSGAAFDTDLSLDTLEGGAMGAIQGQTISNLEIEVVRQWIRFGAKEVYASNDPQPDYGTLWHYYNDSAVIPFFTKPAAPQAGKGMRLRMGPVFLPVSGPFIEQEWLEQQEVNFPYVPEVTEIDGSMNNQSHHFLLFQYADSASARGNGAPDIDNVAQVTPSNLGVLGTTSFDGNKNLTAAWQESAQVKLPTGTALMWDQKTFLDFNFHVKNYNATSVLPCDFYINVYFQPRDAQTIPMVSELINNSTSLGEVIVPQCINIPPKVLPYRQTWRQNYKDGSNGSGGMRYLWMTAGHTHKFGTGYWIIRADTSGAMTDTIYNGQYDYANQTPIGFWDHTHPPLEYFNNGLLPVYFGKNAAGNISGGLVANTSWFSDTTCVHFGFTTSDEMQLFYYMYTTRLPGSSTEVQTINENPFLLTVQPNPVTGGGNGKLVYVLDNMSKVSAEIIDITGKVISRLSDETEVAGAHEISIGGDKKIASGIYFARLVVDGSSYTKKFVVVQ